MPKLGLDLRGGTTITLTAENTTGTGTVDPNSLQLAKQIIQSRVDSLGVGESEVTTAGDRQMIVTVPNVQQDELVQLVGQTAVLRFRAVYAAEQVTPPPQPTPQATGSPAPTEAPSASASVAPEPTESQNRKPLTGPADGPAQAAGPGVPVGRRAGHATGRGDRLAAERDLPGGLRRLQLRRSGQRRRRPGAVRLQPGADREVPARSDPDRGRPVGHRIGRHPAERCQLGGQPGVQRRGGDVVREGDPGAVGEGSTRRTGSPSCWTASSSPRRLWTTRSPAAVRRSRATSTRRARPSWPTS